jgi:hypothetical protein
MSIAARNVPGNFMRRFAEGKLTVGGQEIKTIADLGQLLNRGIITPNQCLNYSVQYFKHLNGLVPGMSEDQLRLTRMTVVKMLKFLRLYLGSSHLSLFADLQPRSLHAQHWRNFFMSLGEHDQYDPYELWKLIVKNSHHDH